MTSAQRPGAVRSVPGISPGEAATVCSRYDLGTILEVRELVRGSRGSPKVVLKTSRGLFLLKRRGPGRDDPRRVALSHQVQLYLASVSFPVARLIGTREENNSMLQLGTWVYELFEFIPGTPFDRSDAATHRAGELLARYHGAMAGFVPLWPVPRARNYASWDPAAGLRPALREARGRAGARAAARQLVGLYEEARRRGAEVGAGALADGFVHGDWHPGNMIFRAREIAAVIDHDSVGRGPRLLDIATGALQFSITREGARLALWPEQAHRGRLAAFLAGYHEGARTRLSPGEAALLPWLMIEAMVVEAATVAGRRRTRLDIEGFLGMAARKSGWLAENAAEVSALA
ncbi:MAG TPA: phosphotransferase [Phycisphaerales bacterium]|nr:phosphotransferase [Phycisphaerales bacterium]